VDGGAVLQQLQLAWSGVLYLHDGWEQLVEALVRQARAAGVALRCGVPVDALETGGPGVGLRLRDGPRLGADAAVLALPLAEAGRLLGPTAELDAAGAALLPARAACLDLGLSALPRPGRSFALGIDAPLYVSVHSASARLAPDGGHLVHAARYLAPDETADRDRLRAELEALLDRVQPGWRDHVVRRRFAPDLRVADGLPAAGAGGLAGRPAVDALAHRGVLLAGDWVGPAGLLSDAARVSGFEAGRRAAAGA
jgi:phytoene dehydrogenase-like protein